MTRFLKIVFCFFVLTANSNAQALELLLYQLDPFAESDIISNNPVSELSVFSAKNEFEPIRFALRIDSSVFLTDVDVGVPRLDGSNGSVILDRPEINVLYQWEQMVNYAVKRNEPNMLHRPLELLLKSDVVLPKGHWNNNRYVPPDYNGQFSTELHPRIAKQFWLSFYVPKNQEVGLYRGAIAFRYSDGEFEIPYSVRVVDVELMDPDKTIGIFYRGSLEDKKRNITPTMLAAQLENINDHSIDSLVIYEKQTKSLIEFLSIAKSSGMDGPIVLEAGSEIISDIEFLRKKVEIIKEFEFAAYVAGVDEPNTDHKLRLQETVSKLADRYGLRVFTSLTTQTYKKLHEKRLEPDWSNINIKQLDVDYFNRIARDQESKITFYWQLYLEKMARNRLYAGLILYKSKLDGVLPYVYQAFHSVEPYSTDVRVLLGNERREKRFYKNFNTTYPTKSRPIDTFQWQSFREGVDDYRYFTLLEKLINTAFKSDLGNESAVVHGSLFLDSLERLTISEYDSGVSHLLQENRALVIEHIVKIQNIIRR